MSKFTPGPWEICECNAIRLDLGPDNNCLLFGNNSETNARLIVAVPKLLKVCKLLIEANRHVRDLSLNRDEPHRGMIWGEARSILDIANLKAEAVITKATE